MKNHIGKDDPDARHCNSTLPGLVQWFRIGEYDRVRQAVLVLNDLHITEFRLLFSWADWESPGGPEWFDFFVHEITSNARARLIPNLFYTPPHMARKNDRGERKTSHPPENLGDYAKFTEEMIVRYGKYFDWVQIWNEPNWKPYWEWDIDPEAILFSEMAGLAADVIHAHGKKSALGGLSPYEPEYITLISRNGLLTKMDAVGIHYSPSWDNQRRKWYGWDIEVETARKHLQGLGSDAEVWIAEAGFATAVPKNIFNEQIKFFEKARKAPADKILWYSMFDQDSDHKTDNEINMNDALESAAYHFGLIDSRGMEKPLYEHWKKLAGNILPS